MKASPTLQLPTPHLEYFKALVEENPSAQRWSAWWEDHKAEMATLLPRGLYLRLTSPMPHTKYMAVFAILEAAGSSYPRPTDYCHPKFYEPSPIPESWLIERIDRAKFERELVRPGSNGNHLLAIRENLRPEDEIWTFSSPQRRWLALMGSSGFAFVRNGVAYDHLATAVS